MFNIIVFESSKSMAFSDAYVKLINNISICKSQDVYFASLFFDNNYVINELSRFMHSVDAERVACCCNDNHRSSRLCICGLKLHRLMDSLNDALCKGYRFFVIDGLEIDNSLRSLYLEVEQFAISNNVAVLIRMNA